MEVGEFKKYHQGILNSPGKVVSLSFLNRRGLFKKTVGGFSGKALMTKVIHIVQFHVQYIHTHPVEGTCVKSVRVRRLDSQNFERNVPGFTAI